MKHPVHGVWIHGLRIGVYYPGLGRTGRLATTFDRCPGGWIASAAISHIAGVVLERDATRT